MRQDKTVANVSFLSQGNRPLNEISEINNEVRSPSKDLLKSSNYIWPSMFSSSRPNLTHQKNLKPSLLRLNPTSHSHPSHKILLEETTHFKHIRLTLKTDSVEKLLQGRSRLTQWHHLGFPRHKLESEQRTQTARRYLTANSVNVVLTSSKGHLQWLSFAERNNEIIIWVLSKHADWPRGSNVHRALTARQVTSNWNCANALVEWRYDPTNLIKWKEYYRESTCGYKTKRGIASCVSCWQCLDETSEQMMTLLNNEYSGEFSFKQVPLPGNVSSRLF
jgi:hypothetical protein